MKINVFSVVIMSKKFPNDVLPEKTGVTFFLRNFSGVLHDLLPQ